MHFSQFGPSPLLFSAGGYLGHCGCYENVCGETTFRRETTKSTSTTTTTTTTKQKQKIETSTPVCPRQNSLGHRNHDHGLHLRRYISLLIVTTAGKIEKKNTPVLFIYDDIFQCASLKQQVKHTRTSRTNDKCKGATWVLTLSHFFQNNSLLSSSWKCGFF